MSYIVYPSDVIPSLSLSLSLSLSESDFLLVYAMLLL